jgi:hypothetical protein
LFDPDDLAWKLGGRAHAHPVLLEQSLTDETASTADVVDHGNRADDGVRRDVR